MWYHSIATWIGQRFLPVANKLERNTLNYNCSPQNHHNGIHRYNKGTLIIRFWRGDFPLTFGDNIFSILQNYLRSAYVNEI